MILFGTISIYKSVLCFGKKVGEWEMPKPTLHLGLCQLSWDRNLVKIGIKLHQLFFFFWNKRCWNWNLQTLWMSSWWVDLVHHPKSIPWVDWLRKPAMDYVLVYNMRVSSKYLALRPEKQMLWTGPRYWSSIFMSNNVQDPNDSSLSVFKPHGSVGGES